MATTVSRRRLGNRLRLARESAQLTAAQVASKLGVSQPTVTRMERGQVGVRARDLAMLLDLYQAEDKEREELLEFGRERERGWWTKYASVLRPGYYAYTSFEAEADEIWDWQSVIVPGHLQTEGYVRALMSGAGPMASEEPERLIEVRMERQRHLAKTRPQMRVVLDESVLHRVVGSQQVMAEQLHRLVEVARAPHVVIQVLPYGQGATAAGLGEFTVLSYADGMQVVWGDTVTGDSCLEEEKPHLCIVAFDHLRKTALPPAASLAMLEQALARSAR